MYNIIQQKIEQEDFLTVVCIGDAQTSQAISKPSWSDWLQRSLWENGDIQKTWRRQVINTAVERATPRHVATYIRAYAAQYHPDIIVLSFGATSFLSTFDESVFLNEFESLADALRRVNAPIVLWSPYPLSGGFGRDATLAVTTLFEQQCQQHGWQFVDVYHEFDNYEMGKFFPYIVQSPYDVAPLKIGDNDPIHIGPEGQYIIAKKLSREIFNLALPTISTGTFTVPQLEVMKRWS